MILISYETKFNLYLFNSFRSAWAYSHSNRFIRHLRRWLVSWGTWLPISASGIAFSGPSSISCCWWEHRGPQWWNLLDLWESSCRHCPLQSWSASEGDHWMASQEFPIFSSWCWRRQIRNLQIWKWAWTASCWCPSWPYQHSWPQQSSLDLPASSSRQP